MSYTHLHKHMKSENQSFIKIGVWKMALHFLWNIKQFTLRFFIFFNMLIKAHSNYLSVLVTKSMCAIFWNLSFVYFGYISIYNRMIKKWWVSFVELLTDESGLSIFSAGIIAEFSRRYKTLDHHEKNSNFHKTWV